ncbi:MAG: response regulator transcription factor [Deltaproteobacteria bacterium]|nr:response regulator transcription factor [Deltaproteobacteria bacterium]
MTEPYQIVLCDDHVMFREGVRGVIEIMPNLKVVGELGDGQELLEFMKTAQPDMVIMDISMPKVQGIEATKEIKAAYPKVKVLILTMHKSTEHLIRAFSAGADGYLLKENARSDLIAAIDKIRHGKTYVSPLITDLIGEMFVHKKGKATGPEEPLTNREIEVLTLLSEGKSSKEIAELLFISTMTVQNHRANIKKKLNMRKNADLVKYAIQKGYTSAGSSFTSARGTA